eukprot:jgi/Botrbrau1/15788/Bobra.4_1s0139.1
MTMRSGRFFDSALPLPSIHFSSLLAATSINAREALACPAAAWWQGHHACFGPLLDMLPSQSSQQIMAEASGARELVRGGHHDGGWQYSFLRVRAPFTCWCCCLCWSAITCCCSATTCSTCGRTHCTVSSSTVLIRSAAPARFAAAASARL